MRTDQDRRNLPLSAEKLVKVVTIKRQDKQSPWEALFSKL